MVFTLVVFFDTPFPPSWNNVVYERPHSDNNMDSLIGFHNSKPTENYNKVYTLYVQEILLVFPTHIQTQMYSKASRYAASRFWIGFKNTCETRIFVDLQGKIRVKSTHLESFEAPVWNMLYGFCRDYLRFLPTSWYKVFEINGFFQEQKPRNLRPYYMLFCLLSK